MGKATIAGPGIHAQARHGIVERRTGAADGGYRLTAAGADLRDLIHALGTWTVRWRFPPPTASNTDSALLLWRMYQGLNPSRLPQHRVTVEFIFPEAEPGRGWRANVVHKAGRVDQVNREGLFRSVPLLVPFVEPDHAVGRGRRNRDEGAGVATSCPRLDLG